MFSLLLISLSVFYYYLPFHDLLSFPFLRGPEFFFIQSFPVEQLKRMGATLVLTINVLRFGLSLAHQIYLLNISEQRLALLCVVKP